MKSNLNLLDIFDDIANEIRARNGTTEPIAPTDMRDQIHAINSWTPENYKNLETIELDPIMVMDNEIQKLNKEIQEKFKNNEEKMQVILDTWDPNTTGGWGSTESNHSPLYGIDAAYLPLIDCANLLNACYMLYSAFNLLNIAKINTSKVTNMSHMFESCTSLTTIPRLDTSKVIYMSYMFRYCHSLITIPQLDTSKVTDISGMFDNCTSLITIPALDCSNVTDMSSMFAHCYSLTSVPLLDTSNVTDMSYMFRNCNSLTSIPQLDTSKVTDMRGMFDDCTSLKEIHMKNINTSLSLYHGPDWRPEFHCPLEHDALVEVISNLMPQTSGNKILTLGSELKAKLSEAEIKVATDKGWTVA